MCFSLICYEDLSSPVPYSSQLKLLLKVIASIMSERISVYLEAGMLAVGVASRFCWHDKSATLSLHTAKCSLGLN